jgi:catechol 2,3-dioxygenase-like lactoylglutathione lyase family enzyme
MPEPRLEFRRFHHVTLAVPDLGRAVADWTERVGWPPDSSSAVGATFGLEDAYVELIPAGGPDGREPGVSSVSVTVDDLDAATRRVKAAGVDVEERDGSVTVDPSALTGVPLELRADDSPGRGASPGPFRRINHVVVAVADDGAAIGKWTSVFGAWPPQIDDGHEVAHHLPVGKAWFGLTTAGTDAAALGRFLERRGEGVYALALVTDDQPATVAALAERGARLVGGEGSRQTFVHPSTTHGLLIDIVPERQPQS